MKKTFNPEKTKNECVRWIREWFEKNGKTSNAVIGISGGKDSSVSAALCVEALGKDRVIGVMMPNGVQSDIKDSEKIINHLDIKSYVINIKDACDALNAQIKENCEVAPSEQTMVNMPPRIRMTVLYAIAQSNNGRVANTCNLSEDIVGYATLYGDSCGSFSPLSKLTTEEIVAIGDCLGLPYDLVHKTPSDGLQSKTDEDNLGYTYNEINEIIRNGIKGDNFDKIIKRYNENKFKTDIIRIPSFEPNLYNYFLFLNCCNGE
jgi:NAD+ synthase